LFISELDTATLEGLKSNHKVVVTLEDGILDGGFGEKIARFFGDSDVKTLCYGIKKEFPIHYTIESILEENRLTCPQITEDILKALK
jgi:1-deoxy-D-xylulose-5-phosphate synthase